MEAYESELATYKQLDQEMQQETDHIKKELLMIEFAKLKRPTRPASIDQKIKRLQSDIRALQQKDSQTHQKALKAAERPNLTFSGSYERLLISGKSI
jgi:predicted  nucleic acid-binding Zn-ribbon protein